VRCIVRVDDARDESWRCRLSLRLLRSLHGLRWLMWVVAERLVSAGSDMIYLKVHDRERIIKVNYSFLCNHFNDRCICKQEKLKHGYLTILKT
jgi:hypothetical protein